MRVCDGFADPLLHGAARVCIGRRIDYVSSDDRVSDAGCNLFRVEVALFLRSECLTCRKVLDFLIGYGISGGEAPLRPSESVPT